MKWNYFLPLLFVLPALCSKVVFSQQLISADTLTVNDKCIIYWQPTMPEYDSVFEKNEVKIDSLFSEFNQNILKLSQYFKKTGIRTIRTDSRFIFFNSQQNKNYIVERKKLTSHLGTIIYDPIKEPLFLPGVNSGVFILKKLKEYLQQ
jgi:hypothetical protein